MTRKLFVTTALPYANAPFHIGHMMEYIQADIWVRFQRMRGVEVHFVCADDTHGAPIMIAAEKAGKVKNWFAATRNVILADNTECILGADIKEVPATLTVGKDVVLTYTTDKGTNTCSKVEVK